VNDLFSAGFKTKSYITLGEFSKVDLSVLGYYFASLAAFCSWYTEQPQWRAFFSWYARSTLRLILSVLGMYVEPSTMCFLFLVSTVNPQHVACFSWYAMLTLRLTLSFLGMRVEPSIVHLLFLVSAINPQHLTFFSW